MGMTGGRGSAAFMLFLLLTAFALPCQSAPVIDRPTLPILYHHKDSLAQPVVLGNVLFLVGPRRATAYHLGQSKVLWDRDLPELGRWECAEIIVSEDEIQILGERRRVRLQTSDGRLQQEDPSENCSGMQKWPRVKIDAPSQDPQAPTFTIDGPVKNQGGVHEILRISTDGEPTLWKVELPLGGEKVVGNGSQVVVVCGALKSTEHSLALFETGARSPQGVYQGLDELPRNLFLLGTRLVVHTRGGDTVVLDLANPGPPESKLPLRDRIRRRLLGLHDQGSVEERLDGLAPDLAANLLGLWPDLSAGQRVGASSYFRKANYKPAAPAVAATLAEVLRHEPRIKLHREADGFLVTPFLEALAVLAGPEEVPVLARALDVAELEDLRLQVSLALAAQGSPEAIQELERRLAPVRKSVLDWWPPPSNGSVLNHLIEVMESDDPFHKVGDDLDWMHLNVWRVQADPEGPTTQPWLIAPLILGGEADLWLAELSSMGMITSLRFLDACSDKGHLDPMWAGRIKDDTLELRHTGADTSTYRIHLPDLDKDADKDGLPDRVERRLRTDPANADTDGDGIKDAVDPAPNARISKPQTEEQEIYLAVAEQFFSFYPDEIQDGLLGIALMDEALEWRGRRGPTITMTYKEMQAVLPELCHEGVLRFSISTRIHAEKQGLLSPLRPDERTISIDITYGGLWAKGFEGKVRRIQSRWYIVELRLTVIS
jgi:hypothetical protein